MIQKNTLHNDSNPFNNKIYLSDEDYSYQELKNAQINSNLAILSACHTGAGVIKKGEGVINLAKGFFAGGVKSILMTLWALDDCASSDLMELFYSYLKKGQATDEALRSAKLEYLENVHPLQTHPYYWANFVHYGSNEILFPHNPYKTPIKIGLILSLFLIVYQSREGLMKKAA